MGWNRSTIGAVGLLNWLVMGLGGVAAGYLSDRFGTRVVVLGGGGLLGLGLVPSSQVREAWPLYVTFGVLVGAGVSTFYVPLTVLAIRWFDDRRGLAAAIVSAGNGLGVLALAPLARWLIFISCNGMGLGSFAGGVIHDALGSYQGLFLGSFAVGAMAVVLAVTLRPPVLAGARVAYVGRSA